MITTKLSVPKDFEKTHGLQLILEKLSNSFHQIFPLWDAASDYDYEIKLTVKEKKK